MSPTLKSEQTIGGGLLELAPIVRECYNEIDYCNLRNWDSADSLVFDIVNRVDHGNPVLDIGCGPGNPITKTLHNYFDVTGIDISAKHVDQAKENVPNARIKHADIRYYDINRGHFSAAIMYYTIFNIHRSHHKNILTKIYDALEPGGLLLFDSGRGDCEFKYQENWLGTGSQMAWSYFPHDWYVDILQKIGFDIIYVRSKRHGIDEDGTRNHPFILAKKTNNR